MVHSDCKVCSEKFLGTCISSLHQTKFWSHVEFSMETIVIVYHLTLAGKGDVLSWSTSWYTGAWGGNLALWFLRKVTDAQLKSGHC